MIKTKGRVARCGLCAGVLVLALGAIGCQGKKDTKDTKGKTVAKPEPGPGDKQARPSGPPPGRKGVVIRPGGRDMPGGVKVSSGGRPVWPPEGPGCAKFVKCCNAAASSSRSMGLACQFAVAKPPVDCNKALARVTAILQERKAAVPPECGSASAGPARPAARP